MKLVHLDPLVLMECVIHIADQFVFYSPWCSVFRAKDRLFPLSMYQTEQLLSLGADGKGWFIGWQNVSESENLFHCLETTTNSFNNSRQGFSYLVCIYIYIYNLLSGISAHFNNYEWINLKDLFHHSSLQESRKASYPRESNRL